MLAGSCAQIQGKTIKTYQSDYRTTVQAGSDALKKLEIPILEQVSDELKTQILARRPNGSPVIVEVTRVDQNFTRVAVSTDGGINHLFDKAVSNQIHGFIRQRLSQTPFED